MQCDSFCNRTSCLNREGEVQHFLTLAGPGFQSLGSTLKLRLELCSHDPKSEFRDDFSVVCRPRFYKHINSLVITHSHDSTKKLPSATLNFPNAKI